MGKALYRKYRSKKLSEVLGQEHVTETLDRALKSDKISHAYLLTGPRGVGKTSIARILAYEVNGLPYDEDASHLDIIEIDAASNRRIDEIRELKERVNIAPTSAKYKVYIIDEVHMLTKEAFNALLKTLEEPPEHAIFILATTEAHKVPETIISRTQRFSFKPVPSEVVVNHLQNIAKQEKITIADDALELIAAHGDGSFRDSISLLDQVRHTSDSVTLQDVQRAVGQAPTELLTQLLEAIASQNIEVIAASLGALRTHGIQAPQVAKQLAAELRSDIINQTLRLPPDITLSLLRDLLQISNAQNPELSLELALFGTSLHTLQAPVITPKPAAPTPEPRLVTPEPIKPTPKPVEDIVPKTVPSPPKKPTEPSELNEDSWQDVLSALKANHNTLYGIARMASPTFDGSTVTLAFAFAFHQKRLSDARNKQLLLNIIREVTGKDASLEYSLIEDVKAPVVVPKPEKNGDLEAISNIFGSAEIVE